jgi:hypothetical protein
MGTAGKSTPSAAGDQHPVIAGAPVAVAAESSPSASHALRRWRSPAVAAAGLAATAIVAVAVVLLIGVFRNSGNDGRRSASAANGTPADDSPSPAAAERPGVELPADTADARLKQLAAWMDAYVDAHGHYPPGTTTGSPLPVDQRLNWMAALAAEQAAEGNIQPQWDRPWHDPLNDRFVRRRIDAFQNPSIAEVVGQDGYPAGHFAGMAGVGVDAAELPLHHGRAGIFGFNRTTRVDDVRDGIANTIMVAGVQPPLASWAAGGAAAIRPFAKEPYVNGPDGFGTGQADGMHVLMADGSVRFLSRDTDPVILRRMAAMADGLPLDSTVPGEPDSAGLIPPPLAGLPPVPANGGVAAIPPAEEKPIDVPVAPDLPVIDIDAALRQRIVSIEQADPVPASKLLQQVAEMAGVTIDARAVLEDPNVADRLNAPVTLSLADTTVRDILQSVLHQARLKFETGEFGIRVSPLESDAP